MGNFRRLKVWQKSKDLAIRIYRITGPGTPFDKDFRFRDQLRSAAVSIPSNIAEGDELGSNKQAVRHFRISKGSAGEIITQLIIARATGHLNQQLADELIAEYEHVSHMLARLIQARST